MHRSFVITIKRVKEMTRMKTLLRLAATVLLAVGITAAAFAQDQPKVTTKAASKFGTLPVFPTCATVSAQRGDPSQGPAVLLAKTASGCVIPRHWHTAGEGLMIVSGKAKIDMKDAAAAALAAGDYVYLPGKHNHQFSCQASCTFFVVTEGAFDIHYVDKDGKEIPVEKALPPAKKPATSGKPAATKK